MELVKFYEEVESHEDLRGLAVDMEANDGEGKLAVEHVPSKLATVVPAEAVEKAEWDVLEEIFTCKRDPQVLYHMTRVVGYYSRVENWNKSKIGELGDRQKGNYAIT
ncbi:MAG: hypothetical protein ACYTFY_04960 [Planctomycetota bacterium]|jgi:hypothetical protein